MGDRAALRSTIPFSGGPRAGGYYDPAGQDGDGDGDFAGARSDPGGGSLFFFYVSLVVGTLLLPFRLVPGFVLRYACSAALVGLVAVLFLELFRTCAAAAGSVDGCYRPFGRERYESIPDYLPVAEPVEGGGDDAGGGSSSPDGSSPPEASAIPVAERPFAIVMPEADVHPVVSSASVRAVVLSDY